MEKKVIAGRPAAKGTFTLFLKIQDNKRKNTKSTEFFTWQCKDRKRSNQFDPNISTNLFQQDFFWVVSHIFVTLGEHLREKILSGYRCSNLLKYQFVDLLRTPSNSIQIFPKSTPTGIFSAVSHIFVTSKGKNLVDIDVPATAEFQNLPKKEENLKKLSSYSGRGGVSGKHGPRFPVDIMSELLVHVLAHPIDVVAGEFDGNL